MTDASAAAGAAAGESVAVDQHDPDTFMLEIALLQGKMEEKGLSCSLSTFKHFKLYDRAVLSESSEVAAQKLRLVRDSLRSVRGSSSYLTQTFAAW